MSTLTMGEWSLEWEVLGLGLEPESGDLHVVAPFDGGVLLGVVDGLGHGPEAAAAARAIAHAAMRHAGHPLERVMAKCHEQARTTRGGVVTLVSFRAEDGCLTWCGIGNVEAHLFRQEGSREAVTPRGGVVGFQLPRPRIASLQIQAGDLLLMATDGIKTEFDEVVSRESSVVTTVQIVFDQFRRRTDDALVLGVRFSKAEPGKAEPGETER